MNNILYKKINSALSNRDVDYCFEGIKKELTCDQADDLLRFLIHWHHMSHELVEKFHQERSYRCPMEAAISEKYENEFKSFVFNMQEKELMNF